MAWDVAGLGNALMDALVVVDDDASLLNELELTRGIMHPVDHDRWQSVYERIRALPVTFDHGGSCANSIATVARLGGRAIYCGQVGNDEMGRLYASLLESACGAHRLRFVDGPTGKCLSIISRKDAERTMLTDLGVAVRLPELGDFATEIRQSRVAHFTGYTLLDGPMAAVAEEAMQVAIDSDTRVSIDAADPFVVHALKETLWRVLEQYASLVFLNEEEARALTDAKTPQEALRKIAEHSGVETIVVKLGSRGSLVRHGDDTYEVPVFPVRALDTTGAGDAYAGGYLYGYVNDWDPARAGRIATAIAGLCVAQVGAVVSDPESIERARAAGA